MEFYLDKSDLISLVMGRTPNYEYIEKLTEKNLGRFSDLNGWHWDITSLGPMTEIELWNLYQLLKLNSM